LRCTWKDDEMEKDQFINIGRIWWLLFINERLLYYIGEIRTFDCCSHHHFFSVSLGSFIVGMIAKKLTICITLIVELTTLLTFEFANSIIKIQQITVLYHRFLLIFKLNDLIFLKFLQINHRQDIDTQRGWVAEYKKRNTCFYHENYN